MTNNINYDDVLSFLLTLVSSKTGVDAETVDVESTLGDLNLDSLDVLDLTFDAELKYDIKFPKDPVGLKTLKDVADLTYQIINEKG